MKVIELDFGVRLSKRVQRGNQVIEMQPARKPKCEAARDSPGGRASLISRLSSLRQNRTRPVIEHLPGARELHPGSPSLEKCRLQLGLQIFDLIAESRLGNAESLCRMGKVEFLRHRDEVTQVPEFHRRIIPETYGKPKKQSIGRMRLQRAKS